MSMRVVSLSILLAIGAGTMPAQTKVTDTTKYKHYSVRGKTPTAIVVDMYRKRRVSGSDFTIATIETKVKPDGRLVNGRGCKIKNFTMHATHVITLPRHVGERQLNRKTRRLFRSFVASARKHELTHRAIYRGCFKRMDRSIRRMRPRSSCQAAVTEMKRILAVEGKRCKAEHAAFDRREYKVSAKMPLLREAIRDAKAMKAARISKAAAANALAGDSGHLDTSRVLLNREKKWRD